MSTPAESRGLILDRIRVATRNSPSEGSIAAELPRSYIRHGRLDVQERLKLMINRLREYDAEVVDCTPEELPATIGKQLVLSGRRRFVAPEGLPGEWLVAGFDWTIDRGLENPEIEKSEGVVTAAFCGVADSGTIVLHHSRSEGRRVLTLLPDWHLCILYASQIVETLPEYFDRCPSPPPLHASDQELPLKAPNLATYISGPSATADIEMTRIKGVHGPRFLNVILVRNED